MGPNVLKLNFNSHPSPNASSKVTFEVQEDFNSLVFASPELGEIIDEEEETAGWDAEEEDLSEVLKQQRTEERKKRLNENQKKKESRKNVLSSEEINFQKDLFCVYVMWLNFVFFFSSFRLNYEININSIQFFFRQKNKTLLNGVRPIKSMSISITKYSDVYIEESNS